MATQEEIRQQRPYDFAPPVQAGTLIMSDDPIPGALLQCINAAGRARWVLNPLGAITALTAGDYQFTALTYFALITTGGTDCEITLADPAERLMPVVVKKVDSGTGKITITGDMDAGDYELTLEGQTVTLQSDGTDYHIIGVT